MELRLSVPLVGLAAVVDGRTLDVYVDRHIQFPLRLFVSIKREVPALLFEKEMFTLSLSQPARPQTNVLGHGHHKHISIGSSVADFLINDFIKKRIKWWWDAI
jgi:hypothetical protein